MKPAKKTKMWKILKEVNLAEREGLTNRGLARRIVGTKDSTHPAYRRLSALTSKLEDRGYLERIGEKENPLARNSPVWDITSRGESFLRFARKGGKISAPKSRI